MNIDLVYSVDFLISRRRKLAETSKTTVFPTISHVHFDVTNQLAVAMLSSCDWFGESPVCRMCHLSGVVQAPQTSLQMTSVAQEPKGSIASKNPFVARTSAV